MVLDSSAIVAIEAKESGYQGLIEKIDMAANAVLIGAPTVLETIMVLTARRRQDASKWVTGFLRSVDADVVPFSAEHLEAAVKAFLRFGKGRHPAALNFGDCMAYATASVAGEPLLYVGNDFAKTDIRAA
jgi:ribonuclease VapC